MARRAFVAPCSLRPRPAVPISSSCLTHLHTCTHLHVRPTPRCAAHPASDTHDDDLVPNYGSPPNPQQTPSPPPKRKKRQLSAESRAKISAALKGKRKSAVHRENLRKRLSGEQNPMYGRKRSAETRAKISKSLTARNRGSVALDDADAGDLLSDTDAPTTSVDGQSNDNVNGLEIADTENLIGEAENLELWRERAQDSRLVKSIEKSENQGGRRTRKLPADSLQDDDIEEMLERVAKLDIPPENIARLIHKTVAGGQVNPSGWSTEESNSDGSGSANFDATGDKEQLQDELHIASETVRQDKPTPTIDPIDLDKLKFRPETRGRRKYKKRLKITPKDRPCRACTGGSGFIACPDCVGSIGVVSSKCTTCFGAGCVFCTECSGSGRVPIT